MTTTPVTVGSLFSGIGGFDLGLERAGMKVVFQVEIDDYCNKVLAKHWPNVRRHADVRTFPPDPINDWRCDLITAGVPCQDVSVAGKRAGLAGERTGLFFDFARILRALRPAWFVFENVPGLLSSNGGRDFAEVLRVLMVECGYGIQWRVLNSQFFGVAQRRCRVFIVGSLGRPCPATILFESEGGGGDSATGQEAGADTAFTLRGRPDGSGGNGQNANYIAAPLTSGSGVTSNAPGRRREDDFNLAIYRMRGFGDYERSGQASAIEERDRKDATDLVGCLASLGGGMDDNKVQRGLAVAVAQNQRGEPAVAYPPPDADGVRAASIVSDWLDYHKRFNPKGQDSARYRGLGNAVTANVAQWIGRRIIAHENSNHRTTAEGGVEQKEAR